MIVRELPDGGLLCIPQPTHALMAAQFCRHWGNRDFARPEPWELILAGVAQHDNGWVEWEAAARLRPDGMPMDFVHYADVAGKAALWRRGVERAWAQHPYMGLLVAHHAALLYRVGLDRGQYAADPAGAQVVAEFLAWVEALDRRATAHLAGVPELEAGLVPAVLEANTRLLQFGDRAALQVGMPWSPESWIRVPVDGRGDYTEIRMVYDPGERVIGFDPWPYRVEAFSVVLEGYRLAQRTFPDEPTYRKALAQAPWARQEWRVVRG